MDDDGSQSNGSGKSSLVMAPLWALTGRSDARAEVGTAHMHSCVEHARGEDAIRTSVAIVCLCAMKACKLKERLTFLNVEEMPLLSRAAPILKSVLCAGWLVAGPDKC